MPEIGRPITAQEMQYKQVTMGPKSLSSNTKLTEAQERERIINKATGQKLKNEVYKDGPHNQMGKDEFMKLLTFQLQNQDPMNPMDQSKFTGELAQFSQLEQLTNLNKKFDDGNKTKALEDKFYAASFVGKKIVTNGSSLDLKRDGDGGDVLFKLDNDASKVLVRVLDEKNNIMGEIWRDGMSRGAHQLTWDGVALDGTPAVKGKYTVQVKAWDDMGQDVGTKTEATGIVQSVDFEGTEPVLTVNNQRVYLRDVVSFHTAETQTHNEIQRAQIPSRDQVQMPAAAPARAVSTESALNAYNDNSGIYD